MSETTRTGGPTGVMQNPAAGVMQRQEFGAQSLMGSAETATAALAAREKAMVESRFIMAMRRPRDFDEVRTKLLAACERPGFAGSATEKVWGAAWYRKPVGEGAEGFSIRFAEEAMRCMGNIDVMAATVYEDDRKRLVTVMVLDLETNNGFTPTITIEKTVERKTLKKGEVPLRTRTNSQGEPVHLLPATEDDIFTKQQNLVSKLTRTGILRILPGDIQAECRARILAIRHGDAAKDPGKLKRQIADGFAALNVSPAQLKDYLGHDLASCTPAELVELRELWEGLKEGKTTWAQVMDEVREERGEGSAPDAPQEKPKTGLDAAAERLKAQAAASAPAPASPAVAAAVDAINRGDAVGAVTALMSDLPKNCLHPSVPPSKLQPGKTIVCLDCSEELTGDTVPEREPGSDDGELGPSALPAPELSKVAGFRATPPPTTAPANAPSTRKGQRTLSED